MEQIPPALLLLSLDLFLDHGDELSECTRLRAALSAVHSRAVGDRIIDLDLARVAGRTPQDRLKFSRAHESS